MRQPTKVSSRLPLTSRPIFVVEATFDLFLQLSRYVDVAPKGFPGELRGGKGDALDRLKACAIVDLLLAGDEDHLWHTWLIAQGIACWPKMKATELVLMGCAILMVLIPSLNWLG